MSARVWKPAAGAVLATALIVAPAGAEAPDDDLKLVKRAVAASATHVATEVAPKTAPAARKRGQAQPQWLKVRVVEKGEKKAKVTVNLPLALVRAMDDFPIDFHCGHRDEGEEGPAGKPCKLKVADVLEALEAGQDLVEIESEDETVRVWVE